jgi:hypothetical protein
MAFYPTYSENKKIIFHEELAELEHNKTHLNSSLWRFQMLEKRIVPEAAVIILEEAKVISSSGIIISKEKVLISDFSRQFGVPINKRKLKLWNFNKINHSKTKAAVVTTEGANTYYHWIYDILPRIFLLEKSGLINEIEIFIFPELKYKFQRESLLKMGFPLDKILEIKNNEYLEVKELIVPSLPSKLGTVNLWSLEFLRNRLSIVSTNNERTKIYISRQNAKERKLLNEDELIKYLKGIGFKIIHSEDLSFDQQINSFTNADVVVAPHGSGLTNIVFCMPNTKIVELFYGEFVVPCFWLIAKQLNLDYYSCFSKLPQNNLTPYWKSIGSSDEFSLEILKELLKEAKII